ncbi:MAG: hypothetical protein ACK5HR_02845 [Mycoplasmatales bacterium]
MNQQISSYEQYNNYVVAQTYLPYQGEEMESDDFDEVMLNYYNLTNAKFEGLIYWVDHNNDEISANNNMLDKLKLKTPNNELITAKDLSTTKCTYLVPLSQKSRYDDSEVYNTVYIQDNYEFIDFNINELNFAKKVKNFTIKYYPNNVKDLADKLNFSALLTRSTYFLNVDATDTYEALKPYIYQAKAQNYIISTPGITVESEEQLANQKENLIYEIFKFILLLIGVGVTIFLNIRTYITINLKEIIVNELEGKNKHNKKLIIYNSIIYLIISGLNQYKTLNLWWLIIVLFLIELLVSKIEFKKQLKSSRIKVLKGDV